MLIGDVFVVPKSGTRDLVERIDDAANRLMRYDWRIYSLTVTPVAALDSAAPPRWNAGP